MIVLGIHDGHDAGAALIKDCRIVAAVNEERLNREKLYMGVPKESIIRLRITGRERPQLFPIRVHPVVIWCFLSFRHVRNVLLIYHPFLARAVIQFFSGISKIITSEYPASVRNSRYSSGV